MAVPLDAMALREEAVGRRRAALLGAIMVVILLASVALAVLLVHRRTVGIRQGAQVLEDIRSRKLPDFWGRDTIADWYIRRGPHGEPVGWFMLQRAPADGGYRGRRVSRLGGAINSETWNVDAAARTCSYSADFSALIRMPGRRVPVLRRLSSTSIKLDDGHVNVRREGPREAADATAEAPENYVPIPEGLSHLAYYRVAVGRRKADFTIVLSDEPVVGGQVRFTPVSVIPREPSSVCVRYARLQRASQDILQFDGDGRLLRGRSLETGTSFERVDFEAVRRIFPEVELFAGSRPMRSPDTRSAAAQIGRGVRPRRPYWPAGPTVRCLISSAFFISSSSDGSSSFSSL